MPTVANSCRRRCTRSHGCASALLIALVVVSLKSPLEAQQNPRAGDATADSTPAPDLQLTPAQHRQAKRLTAVFRQARRSPERRAEAAQSLLALGPPGATLLLSAVEEELRPKLDRYRQAFTAAAQAGMARKAVDPAEVVALREKIRQVSQAADLNEQMIREQSEPALNRLMQLLLVNRASVLESKPVLQEQRAGMAELGQYWQLCQLALNGGMHSGGIPNGGMQPRPNGAGDPNAAPISFDNYLMGEEELAIQLAMPLDDRDRAVLHQNLQRASKLDPEEARGILALNLLRLMSGLNALAIDPILCQTARDHSNDMRTLDFFSHTSPVPGKTSFVDRAARFGGQASAENIAMGPVEGMASLKMWYFSPGHHRNLLGEAQRIGLGRSGNYWTQLFGR